MPYILIIAEKPNASAKIAFALADTKPVKKDYRGVPYYELTHNGENILVGCAVGHLFTLSEKEKSSGWSYPVSDVTWLPSYTVSKSSFFTKKYFEALKKISKEADTFVNGCDLDREGELIFRNVLRFICGRQDAKRMCFSTLTKPDLIEAYENASPHLDFGLAEAGETRHFLDYYWGISLSRALILALKKAGGYKTLSTGRVQGPTLSILEMRQQEINAFIPKPFWLLQIIADANGEAIEALHAKGRFWEKKEAQGIFDKCKGRPAIVEEVRKEQYKQYPFPPFDLTSLQRDAYINFHYSPKQTLDIAQTLYSQALISYPRTSSQKLPPKIGYRKILESLKKQKNYSDFCKALLSKTKLWPREGKKQDPAHPAIYPTGNTPESLNPYQKKIYDLIAKRFLSCFAEPAVRESIRALIDINGEKFKADGVRTVQENWIGFYRPYVKFKETSLPEMKQGQELEVKKLEIQDKETQPPKRFTQASILKEMESENLGTKATRANILQTLYDRGYIMESSILVTQLGESVIKALQGFCPEIISVELTREFERDMEEIQEGKKKREETVMKSQETLKKILGKFKENELKIGQELKKGVIESEKLKNIAGKCPKCGKGDLRIIYSKATHKRFMACNAYPKCRNTFSLPQRGSIMVLSAKCKCGLNLLSVKGAGRRPWKLCIKCGFAKKFKKKTAAEKKAPEKKPAAKTA